ncbi:hypothetical protein HMPREF1989_00224 [Porphyromonas gingivalis F0566]|nr:hypothetical protein HMPREF1989_00224 [Porphyromonas gingivalis F0566]
MENILNYIPMVLSLFGSGILLFLGKDRRYMLYEREFDLSSPRKYVPKNL